MEKISFGKPQARKGYRCVDMHFHSTHSDGAATVDEILKKSRKMGIGVAISDHNEISGSLDALKKKKSEDFIIPAIEVKSSEGVDVLFYFCDSSEMIKFFDNEIKEHRKKFLRMSKTDIPLKDILAFQKKYKCMISIPHMYGYAFRAHVEDMFEKHQTDLGKADIFEAINGGNNRESNEKAIDYVLENNKGFTGGSDGHSIYSLGNVITCAKAKTIRDFFNEIESKRNYVAGIETRYGKLGEYTNYGINRLKNLIKHD
ncbi:MAG: PHP domain-containing protein [archaeon]